MICMTFWTVPQTSRYSAGEPRAWKPLPYWVSLLLSGSERLAPFDGFDLPSWLRRSKIYKNPRPRHHHLTYWLHRLNIINTTFSSSTQTVHLSTILAIIVLVPRHISSETNQHSQKESYFSNDCWYSARSTTMDVRFEVTFKVNALRGFISRIKLQALQLEQQIAIRIATRKSLHHRQFRLRQLAKVKVIGIQKTGEDATKKIQQDLNTINDEVTALSKIHNTYVDCIRRKETEMSSLLIKMASSPHRGSIVTDLLVCWEIVTWNSSRKYALFYHIRYFTIASPHWNRSLWGPLNIPKR